MERKTSKRRDIAIIAATLLFVGWIGWDQGRSIQQSGGALEAFGLHSFGALPWLLITILLAAQRLTGASREAQEWMERARALAFVGPLLPLGIGMAVANSASRWALIATAGTMALVAVIHVFLPPRTPRNYLSDLGQDTQ